MSIRSIPIALQRDPEFGRLSIGAQWALFSLTASFDLKADGVAVLTARRWSGTWSTHASEEGIVSALAELELSGFVRVDDEEGEVFHAKYYEWQRLGAQPRRVAGAWDLLARRSPVIREVAQDTLLAEVARASKNAKPLAEGRKSVFERDSWRCVACGWGLGDDIPLTATGRPLHRGLEVDHVFPKSKGGVDGPENFQTLCTSCNSSKGAKLR
ncbi:HNH endonuclease signature motif containing protein [Kineosporia sp. NBRC 101731]|uniref:HNH endonuclease n=1 Tax=Kineosporia sp. NBRC 101731 TaxID=3032199 RepID=UPI0024A46EEC|nr:HNH endonuclease signature motif containing protein [Kineosporia sp. NBRC 101731]GLY32017.1 hypothetical protein Kisp02_53820 [Kineosporia sp. NBRC 101731]